MSTYNMVTVAAAIQNRKRQNELTAKELEAYAVSSGLLQRSKALEGVESRLTSVRKEMYAMNADKLKLKLKYFQDRDNLSYKIQRLDLEDQWKQRDIIAREITDHAKTQKKLLEGLNAEDKEATRRLNGLFEGKVKTSTNTAIARFKSLTDLDLSTDSKDLLNPGVKKGHANSMKIWMDKINAEVPGNLQIFNTSGPSGAILNLDELKDADNPDNPLRKAGLSRGSIITAFEPAGSSLFDQYNEHQESSYKALGKAEEAIKDLEGKAAAIQNSKTPEELKTHLDIRDDLIKHDEVFTKGSGIDTANLNQLTEELALYESAQRSERRLEKLANELVREQPSAAVQLRDQMARRMSSPYIRAWARDNGFDELGHVTVEDGSYDPASYIPGRDDMAVVRAFNRQAGRGAGRYGFKSIGSGDIVQVTVDGSPVVGERLKYHAGDPVGTVRVMTETGEVITLAPGDVDQVVVIERRPDRVSPLVNRAKGRAYRMQDQIRAARERAGVSVPGSEDNAFISEQGNYVIDSDTGRYIDELEHNQKLDEFIENDTIQGKVVDGKQYLVKRVDGTMFEFVTAEDGTSQLIPVDIEDENLAAQITAAPARRVIGSFAVEGQDEPERRILKRTDTDVAGLDLMFEPLMGEDGYSEESVAYFESGEQQKRAGVSFNELGYKETDQQFSPLAGQTYKNEYSVGGMKFVDLDQAPPRPPSPSEGLTPGVDGPAEQPTGFKNQFEADKAAIEAAAAEMGERPETPEEVSDQPTEPEIVDKGVLFDAAENFQKQKDEGIRRKWNGAAQEAMKRGEPLPEIPFGWEVVEGELQKISDRLSPATFTPQAQTPPSPPTPPATDLDTSTLDLEAITGTPQQPPAPTPAPTPTPPPILSDAEVEDLTDPEVDKEREEEHAARMAQLQAMGDRIKARLNEKKDEGKKTELPADAASILEATPKSQEKAEKEAEKKSGKSFELLNELLVDRSKDSGNVLLSDKFDVYLEASKAEGLTVQQATERLRNSMSNFEDESGKPIPLKLVDGEVVRVDPPTTDEEKPPEDPLGQRLEEVDEEDEVAAQVSKAVGDPPERKVTLTPEQEAAEKAASIAQSTSAIEKMKGTDAGKFTTAADKQRSDAAAAASALSFFDAMNEGADKDADTVQAEGDMPSAGVVPGKSTADSVKQMDDMLKRMEKFKADAADKRTSEEGFQQGLETIGGIQPSTPSNLP
mgnify:CR=1 FL=1